MIRKIKKFIAEKRRDISLEMSQSMLIGVDFDGTCVEHAYPEVGRSLPGAAETLRALTDREHKIILWTCREDDPDDPSKQYLSDAVNWFKERDIPLVGINETPLDEDFRENGGRKIFANIYIDDTNFGGFPGWPKIHEELIGLPLFL